MHKDVLKESNIIICKHIAIWHFLPLGGNCPNILLLRIYYLAEPALLPEAQTELHNFRDYVNIDNSAVFAMQKKTAQKEHWSYKIKYLL